MLLMNERNQMRTVAERWRRHYGNEKGWKKPVLPKLLALDVEKDGAEKVAEIIGNGSWVCQYQCNECGEKSWEIAQVGEPVDYESSTAFLCRDCLRSALKLLDDGR